MSLVRDPLTHEQVARVIERRGAAPHIPLVLHKWWGVGLVERYGDDLARVAARYPDDIVFVGYTYPGKETSPTDNPSYRWGFLDDYGNAETHGIAETRVLLPEWEMLDDFLDDFPDPNEPGIMDVAKPVIDAADGRYVMASIGNMAHERFWMVRGMENLMVDYYENPEGLKAFGEKLLAWHCGIIDRFADLGAHGCFVTDDLGHQNGPFMSPGLFRDIYYPLYRRFAEHCHKRGMHYFVHSCGDNTLLMEMLIEAGADVFHPIQTGCMDIEATARNFGGRISWLAGFDVQHLLPEGTPDQIRQGVRTLCDALARPDGGLLLAAGNGIMPDTPLENIDAFLDEATRYVPRCCRTVGV